MPRQPERQNLIIFDWDDTLFPTTAVRQAEEDWGLREEEVENINRFQELEEPLSELLQEALRLAPGATYIVTNAGDGWIKECVSKYYPSIEPFIDQMHVISARQYFCERHGIVLNQALKATAEDCLRWKAFTLASLATAEGEEGMLRSLEVDPGKQLSVVSVGDAPTDASATQFLRKFLPRGSWVKTVQLIQTPNFEQVKDQQKLLRGSLSKVCRHPASASLCVGRRSPAPENGDAEGEAVAGTPEAEILAGVASGMKELMKDSVQGQPVPGSSEAKSQAEVQDDDKLGAKTQKPSNCTMNGIMTEKCMPGGYPGCFQPSAASPVAAGGNMVSL
jgi:hypothetical protein